jgi:hypothetical protein
MAKFLKHVGKHGDRKVAVVFRQIPGEEHMSLVIYTEILNQNIHDPLIQTIESDLGQSSYELGEALNRSYTKDGQIILQVLHREGMMKKVQASQIIMTPYPGQHVKLDELNKILTEMKMGEEAVKRLAEIDASRGLQDPKDVARRMRGESTVKTSPAKKVEASNGLLGDSELANNLRSQAAKMSTEAKGLLAEAARLEKEAAQLEGIKPEPANQKKTRVVKSKVESKIEPKVEVPVKKTRTKKAVVSG